MQKRSLFGAGLIVLGLIMIFAEHLGITGAVVGLEAVKDVWFYFIGAAFIIAGLALSYASKAKENRLFWEFESKLKGIIGEAYDALTEKEPWKYYSSYRRKQKRQQQIELSHLRYTPKAEELLNNEAADYLKRRYIPERRKEFIGLAERCGYDVETGKGEGYVVRNKKGRKVTEIGKSKMIKRGTARKILIALATGKFQGRKTA